MTIVSLYKQEATDEIYNNHSTCLFKYRYTIYVYAYKCSDIGPRMQSPKLFYYGSDISNTTLRLPKDAAVMSILCKSEFDIIWSINQRILGTSPKLMVRTPGLYLCRAKVNDTNNSYVSYANIHRRLAGFKPHSAKIEGTVRITVGDTLRLACTATGRNLSYGWFIDGRNVSIGNSSVYVKNNSDEGDAHLYYCRVENIYGFVQTRHVKVIIGKPPSLHLTPPDRLYTFYPNDVPVDVLCQSVENSTLLWMVTMNGTTSIIRNNTIRLGPQTFDSASCIGKNEFGTAEADRIQISNENYFLTGLQIKVGYNDSLSNVVPSGTNIKFHCAANGKPKPSLSWTRYQNDVETALSSRATVHSNGTMSIIQAKIEDSGVYVCTAENIAFKTSKKNVLSIMERPVLSIPDVTVPFVQGRSVNITCRPNTASGFTIKWLFDNTLTVYQKLSDTFAILAFENLTKDTNATCIATNEAGTSHQTFSLISNSAIKLSAINTTTIFTSGETLVLNCDVQGLNPENTKWFLNNETLFENVGTQLIIENVDMSHDGKFTCVNDNLQSSVDITVLQLPLVNINYPDSSHVKYGMDLSIRCNASGNPLPVVEMRSSSSLAVETGSVTLQVRNITQKETVECAGQNTIGRHKQVVHINVIDPWVTPGYQEVDSGTSITMKCFTGGKRQWFGPKNQLIVNNDRYEVFNETLRISKIFTSESGSYTCRSGLKEDSVRIFVKSLPAQFTQTPISMAKMVVPNTWYEEVNLTMKFETMTPNGILLFVPGSNKVDYLKLEIIAGRVVMEWNLGSGIGRIESDPIVIGAWNRVAINRKHIEGKMIVNDMVYTGKSAGLFRGFDSDRFAFIGRTTIEYDTKAFFGCITQLTVNGDEVDFGMLENTGISKCGLN